MSTALVVQSLDSVPMEGVVMGVKTEVSEERKLYSQENQPPFSRKNAMISRIRSNTACRNYHIGSGSMPNKRSKQYSNGKVKHGAQKQVDAKSFASLLASREAQEEILKYEVFIFSFFKLICSIYRSVCLITFSRPKCHIINNYQLIYIII